MGPMYSAAVLLFAALPGQDAGDAWRRELRASCLDCHGADSPKGGLNLEKLLADDVSRHAGAWEKVVRRLRTRQMPPAGKPRPTETAYASILAGLEGRLDAVARTNPDPGRPDTLRRLTRLEYQNAIRDLLALDVDASTLLPPDESAHGFDTATAGTLSATLLDRLLTAAGRISRLALGRAGRSPGGETFRVRPDITQEERIEGLPAGTRGGTRIRYTFPADGEYEVRIRLMRDRNEEVEGLSGTHPLIVLLDRKLVQEFAVKPPRGDARGHAMVDAHLQARLRVSAGPHELGVTFLKNPTSVIETLRQPYDASFNTHRHPRQAPAVYEVSVIGPYDAAGPGDTPSRRLLQIPPNAPADEEASARGILTPLLRRAFRRPVAAADVERILQVYRDARKGTDLEGALEAALSAVLVSHDFLFRVERDPEGLAPRTAYPLSDVELASRLSFFLWSSLPDDTLLDLAERGELRRPEVLEREARRMLADPRAATLATSFASQWLQIRNLEGVIPDGRLFPDFDDNLRQALRRETELLFGEILREDRSVTALLRSDHAWLNERLAKHYGIPHVYGTRFRPVALAPDSGRGGLFRHGSILTITSYANRTSPVLRGKWILETVLGTPPPPPPPDVPALEETPVSERLPVRERLRLHRSNPACASCHRVIDPVGFLLEHFDAVGRFRETDGGRPVDAEGGLPDGSAAEGVAGLETALLKRPDIFVTALAEKLLTYALGRAVGPPDGPALREVVSAAEADGHRFSAIVAALVKSAPFRMRRTP